MYDITDIADLDTVFVKKLVVLMFLDKEKINI